MNNLSIKISNASPIILPISKKNISIPFQFSIKVTNNTSMPICFCNLSTLVPELIDSEGQTVNYQTPRYLQNYDKQNNNCDLILPQKSLSISRYGRLYWELGKLQMSISIFSDEGLKTTSNNAWIFEQLHSETYQIRFKENRPLEEAICKYPYLREQKREISISEEHVTQFINLHLINVDRSEQNIIDFQGVQFETVISQTLHIPFPKNTTKHIPVELGIRISNHSSKAYRFIFYNLRPLLLDEHGNSLKRSGGQNRIVMPTKEDFLLVNNNECIYEGFNASLYWIDNELKIGGQDKFAWCWSFGNLQPGTYQIGFVYTNNDGSSYPKKFQEFKPFFADLWVGTIQTLFVSFSLV
jgi:hypothetical protein